MFRDGPVPRFVHGILEYVAGVFLIALPFIIGFSGDEGGATAASIVLGVLLIVFTASTSGRTSMVNTIPATAHIAGDFIFAVAFIILPFLFGLQDEYGGATAIYIALGVVHMLVTIGTRFRSRD